jgi:2-polyprenyl-3-methyl-5-hydroxy-6-metoxy-1,4-benzoquinol methylase
MKQPDPVIAEPEQVQPDDMRACPLCGSREVHFLWHVTDKKFRGPGRFAYWRCAGCGLAMLHPRLSEKDLAPYYPDYVTVVRRRDNFRQRLKRMVAEDWYGYGSDRPDVTGWLRKAATFPLRRLLSQLPYKRSGGRVLDIGCGSGGYLAFLADLGWTCEGIEQGPNSRRYAQQELGLTVHSDLRQLQNFPDRCFDVVTMWHVIEHLADPFETLGAVHRVLKPGGLLMLRTPNADSWEARLFQGRWYGVDAPRHLYLFSPGTLERCLARAGFVSTDIRYQYHPVDCSRSCLYAVEDAGWGRLGRVLARWAFLFESLLAACVPLRRALGRGGAVHVNAFKVPA